MNTKRTNTRAKKPTHPWRRIAMLLRQPERPHQPPQCAYHLRVASQVPDDDRPIFIPTEYQRQCLDEGRG